MLGREKKGVSEEKTAQTSESTFSGRPAQPKGSCPGIWPKRYMSIHSSSNPQELQTALHNFPAFTGNQKGLYLHY